MTGRDVSPLFVHPADSIADVIAIIDRSGPVSLALVVDERNRLLNTISDGDVRRGILAGLALEEPASRLLEIKARTPYPEPVTAPLDADPLALRTILRERAVRQLPLLDPQGAVVDIVTARDFEAAPTPFRAIVMAGGRGLRLRPLTESIPKPMLPIGGRPVMEIIVEQLKNAGVRRIHVSTNYQAEKIMEHFGAGESFGVEIEYVREDEPLGTGGALGLIEKPTEPVLVINGDILTQVDFLAMYAFHHDQKAEMTVGVRRYEMQVPYGVVDCDGAMIRGLHEKPQVSFFVNAGIYLLEPSVFDLIECHRHLNITDLVKRLIDAGRAVASYPICEYWLDIGRIEDYERAQVDASEGRLAKPQVG
jgi:dTDP-glucose pyrophosphorylase